MEIIKREEAITYKLPNGKFIKVLHEIGTQNYLIDIYNKELENLETILFEDEEALEKFIEKMGSWKKNEHTY